MGTLDRAARFVVGALLIVLALTGTIGVWGWLGLIFVGTAFISFCPLYKIIGMKTCSDC
jgi:O-antigen ligase